MGPRPGFGGPPPNPLAPPSEALQIGIGPITPQTTGPSLPANMLGTPPPQVQSYAPPIAAGSNRPFGELTVAIIAAKNLKAGQGVFGKADPYVKLKLGEQEHSTNPDSQGGKNPVSSCSLCFESKWTRTNIDTD
mmetsp:Transcript_56225/g.168337  ORF Transcript_56225/g.168337 Transcript_56225/m.168337 type:complete len:134 (-) Transcript_56225:1112-1513(-)